MQIQITNAMLVICIVLIINMLQLVLENSLLIFLVLSIFNYSLKIQEIR